MTTISRTSAFPAAARMMCSSWCRIINRVLLQYGRPLMRRQHSSKGIGLTQANRPLIGPSQQLQHLRNGQLQHSVPLQQRRPHLWRTGCQPSRDGCAASFDQRRISTQSHRNSLPQGKAAFVDGGMILHEASHYPASRRKFNVRFRRDKGRVGLPAPVTRPAYAGWSGPRIYASMLANFLSNSCTLTPFP